MSPRRRVSSEKRASARNGRISGCQNPKLKGWEDKYLGRKKLLWDAKNMKITNFDEANQFVKRDYRSGYSLTM